MEGLGRRGRWVGLAAAALLSLLFASAALAQDPPSGVTDPEAVLAPALEAIRGRDYETAITLLQEILRERPGDLEALRLLVIASFRGEDYATAIEAAERYLGTQPDSDVRLLLARAHEARGDLEAAREVYRTIAEDPDDPYRQLAADSVARLDAAAPEVAAPTYFPRPEGLSGLLIAAVETSDNIASSVDEGTTIPSDVGDQSLNLTANLDYDFTFGERIFAGIGGLGFGKFHQDQGSPFDLQLFRGDLHAGLVGEIWRLKLAYEHDEVAFDYDKEVVSDRVRSTVIVQPRDWFATIGIASLSWDDYPNQPLQDAVRFEAQSRNRFYLRGPEDYLTLKLDYSFRLNETRDKSVFRYYFNKVGAGIRLPISFWDLYFDLDGSIEHRVYDEPNPVDRRDQTVDLSFVFGKDWTRQLSTELSYFRTRTYSTVDAFDRIENVFGASVIFAF